MPVPVTAPEDYLSRFGLERFRPGQRDVIAALLDGFDCLCIMPTGGGKSLCYQLPSIAREGTTLVVSPLIALMKDQVDVLVQRDIRAAYVNSSLSAADQSERLHRFSAGEYDLLYVAPERFRSPRFLEAVRQTPIQLLAVDEAHCISEWGHDFRHDYARLGEFRRRLGNPQTIALTATATTDVREDVVRQLELKEPRAFVAGFARENLHYRVEQHRGKQAKQKALLDFLGRTPGCGIIYASTRAACDEMRELVSSELKRSIIAYHGGLLADDRRRLQDVFMEGRADIVAATNAFGMGIDKPDVRFVVHYNIPGSLEAYYQEAGRAGRDGDRSECLLLYSPSDRFVQEFFIDSAHPPKDVIQQVYEYLCKHPDDPIELTQQDLKEKLGLAIGTDGVGTCERLLEKADVLERLDSNRNMAAVRVDADAPNLAELLPPQAQTQRRVIRAVGHLVGSQRFERVYFHLRDVAELSGQDSASISRALRELSRSDWFDYVPPFRGRAVHMLRRDVPFHRLDIDYTRLEERRKSNLDKLDRVIRFALTRGCRQRDILRYFGDTSDERCGHCDNCDTGPSVAGELTAGVAGAQAASSEATPAMIEITRMVLSGVARTHGRFGKQLVVAMLCGSKSARVSRWKLDQLSTFGLLEGFKQSEVSDIADALISMSLMKLVEIDKFRPTIHNTELGTDVMRGRKELPCPLELEPSLARKIESRFGRWQKAVSTPPVPLALPAVPDDVPPTAVVRDEEKEYAARLCEQSREEPDQQGDRQDRPEPDTVHPSHYWTWRLLKDGYTARQCAAIRQLRQAEVCDHLLRSCEEGMPVQPGWLLDADQLVWLDAHIPYGAEIRPLLADLPAGVTSGMVELFVKCRSQQATRRRSNA